MLVISPKVEIQERTYNIFISTLYIGKCIVLRELSIPLTHLGTFNNTYSYQTSKNNDAS